MDSAFPLAGSAEKGEMMGATQQGRGDDANRVRLLNAATRSFGERGFHGTTTRDIAAQAGMSPAAVYVHHRSKEDLLFSISRTGHERTLALIKDAVATHDDPTDQLRAFAYAFARFHAEESTSARVINYELAALNDEHSAEIHRMRRAINDEVYALVARGAADGSFTCSNTHMTAIALTSLGVDIARWYRSDGAWTPEDVAKNYVEIALRIVGAH